MMDETYRIRRRIAKAERRIKASKNVDQETSVRERLQSRLSAIEKEVSRNGH